VFILALIVIAVGGALLLFALRAATMGEGGLFRPVSREGALLLNNLLLAIGAAIVFIGTLYPLFLDALHGDKISVGPPYFNATFGPVMALVLLAVPFGPMLAWKRGDLLAAAERLWAAALAAGIAILVALYLQAGRPVLAAFGLGLAAWLVVGALVEWGERTRLFRAPPRETWSRAAGLPRAAYGMTLAHAGLGVLLAGIIGAALWQQEEIRLMRPGESMAIAGYTLEFRGLEETAGPNYTSERGRFLLRRGGEEIATLHPEKRFYPVQQMPTTEAAIRTTGVGDLYLVLGDPAADGAWSVRAYHNPLAPWIWAGAVIMAAGGLLSLSDRRHRIGVPALRRRREAVAAAQ
jgi:cytochrome c-type biogenesis protein CcmF